LRGSQQTEPLEAAPARALRSADISALLPQAGWSTVHARQHQREVCRLSPQGDLARAQPLSGPLQVGVRLLPPPVPAACSAGLAVRFPWRYSPGQTTGLPRSVVV